MTTDKSELRILPDQEAVATAAAELFLAVARQSVADHGRFTVALSGGSTPALLFGLLASPPYSESVPWEKTHVFWSDERWVPRDDPESNSGLARRLLLDHVPVPPDQVHYVTTTGMTPDDSTAEYGRMLRDFYDGGEPRLDLVLLGMGDDGHTASLFPRTEALNETHHRVFANYVPALNTWRITFTYRTINAAHHVCFMVVGPEKRAALRHIFAARAGENPVPAALVNPTDGQLLWLVDEAAARDIKQ
jgi:6-phosphogluconolactonase